jgi:hypothetical protein
VKHTKEVNAMKVKSVESRIIQQPIKTIKIRTPPEVEAVNTMSIKLLQMALKLSSEELLHQDP